MASMPEETKAKIRAKMLGNHYAKGYKWTPEQREKLRGSQGAMSPETKAKIAEKMKGNSFAKGYKWSEEQKAKLKNTFALKKANQPIQEEVKTELQPA